MRERGGYMGQRHPLNRRGAIWDGHSLLKGRERHCGHVRAGTGASARFAAVWSGGLFRRKRVTGDLLWVAGRLSVRMLVTGHDGSLHLGRRMLQHWHPIDVHAGGGHRAPYPIEDKSEADEYTQQGRPDFHRITLSHASPCRVEAG